MPITYADLLDTWVAQAGVSNTAKATVLTTRTSQEAWPGLSAVATAEHTALIAAGTQEYEQIIGSYSAVQQFVQSLVLGQWNVYAARYIRDNLATFDTVTAEQGSLARALVGAFITDSQTLDASAPTAGTVVYGEHNQGTGTATMAINSNTTLAELALAGLIRARCRTAGFAIQNAERWDLEWVGVDPRTGAQLVRTSPTASRFLRTGERYFDVAATVRPGVGLSPDPRYQIPQIGSAFHCGLNILISVPTYTPTEASGDVDSVCSAPNVSLLDGTKTVINKDNSTATISGATHTATIYLRIAKDGSNYNCTWYADSGLLVALTNTIVLTTASGTATQTWTAAATNPSVISGEIALGANFVSLLVAAGSLTQSATVLFTCPLPWAVGDTISVPITNSYAGINSRFVVEECGFALPVNNAGGETIADPA